MSAAPTARPMSMMLKFRSTRIGKAARSLSELGKAPFKKKTEGSDLRPPPPKPDQGHGSIRIDMTLASQTLPDSLDASQLAKLHELMNIPTDEAADEVSYEVMLINIGIAMRVFDDYSDVQKQANDNNVETKKTISSAEHYQDLISPVIQKYTWAFFVECPLNDSLRLLLQGLIDAKIVSQIQNEGKADHFIWTPVDDSIEDETIEISPPKGSLKDSGMVL